MECREFLSNLSEFVDGRLDEAESRTLEQHAADCAGCENRLRDYRALNAALPLALSEAEPPTDRMWAAIRSQLPATVPERRGLFDLVLDFVRDHALALVPVSVAAVALVAYLGFGSGMPTTVAQAPAPGAGRTSTHSSGEQRQIQELDARRWDYIETGFKQYARTVRSKHSMR